MQTFCKEVRRFAGDSTSSFKVSLAALLLALLFSGIDVEHGAYIWFVVLISVALLTCFSVRKNIRLYLYYACVLLISEVVFYVKDGFSLPIWLATFMLIWIGTILIVLARCLYCLAKTDGSLEGEVAFKNIFKEREQDLERLARYIVSFKVLGVNSFWGNGKTCLYEMFKAKNEGAYYFVSISVMTLQLDSVEKFLVSEISRVLEQNKIYSAASAKLASFVNGDSFHGIGRFFVANSSYTESFKTLMADISRLDRPLFITFEDIDRVSDVKIAHKVFAISEMLTRWTNHIRVLFQYDRSRLAKIFEGEQESYIEKYIPYTIDLTPISFGRCLKVILKEGHDRGAFKKIKENDFYTITLDANIGSWLAMAGIGGIGTVATLTPKWYSIRSIELFIKEVDALMTEDASYDKKVVVLFQFVKHFMPGELFNVNLSEGIYDNPIFSFEGTNCNIQRILSKLKGIEDVELRRAEYAKIFPADSTNLFYLLLMNKLGYKLLKIHDVPTPSNVSEQVSGILNEKVSDLSDKDYNEKLDRLVRRMYAMGRSDRTDLENAVKELEKVLDVNGSERVSAFRDFLNKSYYQDFERVDNVTIFRLGMPQFLSIFRSFLLYERSSLYWVKLLDLYFSYCNVTGITATLIQCLNYCSIEDRDVFLDVVKRFNGLEIKGNLKKTKSYPIFLRKYIQKMLDLTGIREYNFELLMAGGETDSRIIDEFKGISEGIKSQLRSLQKEAVFNVIKDDCAVLCGFLDKNNLLINSQHSLKEFEINSSIHTEIHSSVRDIENQIKKGNLNSEQLKDLLIDNYKHGNLKATDVHRLWDNYRGH